MRRLIALPWLLLFALTATAETKIDGPTSVAVSQPAWFTVGGMESGDRSVWFPSPQLQTDSRYIKEGVSLFWSDKPGKFQINVMVVDCSKNKFIPLSETIAVGSDPGPDPIPPGPDPPDPDPPDPNQKWQVVIVFESADLDNYPRSQQVMLGSLTFRDALAAKGHKLVVGGIVDKDIKDRDGKMPEALKPFLGAAAGKTLPQLCIAPIEGGEVKVVPLPLTEAAVFEVLEAVR